MEEVRAVLDRVTSDNQTPFCRFVECCNCGRIMLVNREEHTCPECDCKYTLSAVDGTFKFVEYKKAAEMLADMGYQLCDVNYPMHYKQVMNGACRFM